MTICIAAISEDKKVIAVADKMLTIENPIRTAFEISDNNKIAKLGDKSMALFAGDVIQANEILRKAQAKIDTEKPKEVLAIANIVRDAFSEHWEAVVSNYLFTRYRLNLDDFMKNQGSFDPDLIKQINELVSKFSINVQIIVAGVDSRPRIYTIDNSTSVIEQTPIGYACIGSGEIHASLSLIESEYSKSHDGTTSLYALLEAKKRAEYDPGVGEYSDIAIVNSGFEQLKQDDVTKIVDLMNSSKADIKKVKVKYQEKIKEVKDV